MKKQNKKLNVYYTVSFLEGINKWLTKLLFLPSSPLKEELKIHNWESTKTESGNGIFFERFADTEEDARENALQLEFELTEMEKINKIV